MTKRYALIPDGYDATGKSRPFVRIEVIAEHAHAYQIKRADGTEEHIPLYTPLFLEITTQETVS